MGANLGNRPGRQAGSVSRHPAREAPPARRSPVRVVVHRGLRDACTLGACLAIIDSAQSHLCAVNGFALVLEIQHALLRALRRRVRVRTLFGHLSPTHADEPFAGSWASARAAPTALFVEDVAVAAATEARVDPAQARSFEAGVRPLATASALASSRATRRTSLVGQP